MVTSDAHEVLFGCNHLGCIAMLPIASCIPFPFSALCDDMFTMLVCATPWLYMHFYTLTYMSMHESCLLACHSCFNKMQLWTSNPNLHLSPSVTTFCLLFCLFAFVFVFLLSASLLVVLIMLIHFMPFSYALCIFSFHCLFAGFLSFAFTCTHMERGRMELGCERKQKGCGCKHVDMSQAAMFSRFRSLVFPIWLCILLNSFLPPPLPPSLLDGLY